MKRLILSSLMGWSLLISGSLFAQDQEVKSETTSIFPFTGKVSHAKVRLRAAPNLESYIIREVGSGEFFAVMGEEGDFFAVAPPKDSKGFVFRTLILDNVVEGDKVNVRLHPDIESPIIGKLTQGQKVETHLCDVNPKWYEVTLPQNAYFYIAKELLDNMGPLDVFNQRESKKVDAEACIQFFTAQVEDLKTMNFEEINFEEIEAQVAQIKDVYKELPHVGEKATSLLDEALQVYTTKKLAYLEQKSHEKEIHKEVIQMPIDVLALEASEKMNAWIDAEEQMFQSWLKRHPGQTIESFYKDEKIHASTLTGVIESYQRPVHNSPGNFLLRIDNIPVAFLYSTKVDLEKLVGQKVTLYGTERPNNNFAFPAYFVLSTE